MVLVVVPLPELNVNSTVVTLPGSPAFSVVWWEAHQSKGSNFGPATSSCSGPFSENEVLGWILPQVLRELTLPSLLKGVLGTAGTHCHSSPDSGHCSLCAESSPAFVTFFCCPQHRPVPELGAYTSCPWVPIMPYGSYGQRRSPYRRVQCRPPEAYARCRTGSAHGGSC